MILTNPDFTLIKLKHFYQVLYNKLGIENKKTVFLFTDSHVAEEGFLELINNMLTSGMVPALYADDEKEGIIGQMRDEASKLGSVAFYSSSFIYLFVKLYSQIHSCFKVVIALLEDML